MRALWPLLVVALLAGCRGPAGDGGSSVVMGERSEVSLSEPPSGTLQVAFLDVGQGDAALVQVGGKSLLIDGGPSGAGDEVVAAVRAAGVEKLDWVMGSHPHEDHIGGLIDVFEEVPVGIVFDPAYTHGTALQKKYLALIKEKGARPVKARAGQVHDLGSGARLEILAPAEPLIDGTDSDANNNSIVARLVFGTSEFLFTGDVEKEGRERLLRDTPPAKLRSDVLKVSHHGSRNGTDTAFLGTVRPDVAVISCARGNDYGHPHPEALQALKDAGVPVLRTDEQGTMVFTSDGKSLHLKRAVAARPATPAASGPLIGNRSSQVYHSPECGSLPDKDRRVEFAAVRDAERAGYRPHRACMQ